MADERSFLYSRRHIERLIDGAEYVWSRDVTGPRPRWIYVEVPQESEPEPRAMWAGLLSSVETTGDLDTEAAMIVMDLERALHLLSRLHADAAAVVAARVMNDFTDFEMDAAFPQVRGRNGRIVRPDWRRLRDRSVAWLSAYLTGSPISSADPKEWTCEKAYRDAR